VKSESWDGKYTNYNSYYIKESETYLARDMFKETYGSFTDENGRWIAENICKQIEHTMKVLEADIARYEEELRQVDKLEAERKRIKAEVEAFNKKVSWIGNEYFGLRI
jgi:polyhydroxyalkanoate synthesis regulator phasin